MKINETVQLENFVYTALLQIMSGVSKAKPEIEKLGGKINPALRHDARKSDANRTRRDRRPTTIEFDVAVTATISGKSQYGIGVIAAFLSAGATKNKQTTDSTISRIRFSIPIELPVTSDF